MAGTLRPEPVGNGLRCPLRALVGVTRGAGVRSPDPLAEVRARYAEAVIPTRVDDHVRRRGHVALDALGTPGAGLVVVVLARIVFRRRVAAVAQRVALVVEPQAMGVVAIAARDSLSIHLALQKRAVNVDFFEDLAIGVIQAFIEESRRVRLRERASVLVGVAEHPAARVTACTDLDLSPEQAPRVTTCQPRFRIDVPDDVIVLAQRHHEAHLGLTEGR